MLYEGKLPNVLCITHLAAQAPVSSIWTMENLGLCGSILGMKELMCTETRKDVTRRSRTCISAYKLGREYDCCPEDPYLGGAQLHVMATWVLLLTSSSQDTGL